MMVHPMIFIFKDQTLKIITFNPLIFLCPITYFPRLTRHSDEWRSVVVLCGLHHGHLSIGHLLGQIHAILDGGQVGHAVDGYRVGHGGAVGLRGGYGADGVAAAVHHVPMEVGIAARVVGVHWQYDADHLQLVVTSCSCSRRIFVVVV